MLTTSLEDRSKNKQCLLLLLSLYTIDTMLVDYYGNAKSNYDDFLHTSYWEVCLSSAFLCFYAPAPTRSIWFRKTMLPLKIMAKLPGYALRHYTIQRLNVYLGNLGMIFPDIVALLIWFLLKLTQIEAT